MKKTFESIGAFLSAVASPLKESVGVQLLRCVNRLAPNLLAEAVIKTREDVGAVLGSVTIEINGGRDRLKEKEEALYALDEALKAKQQSLMELRDALDRRQTALEGMAEFAPSDIGKQLAAIRVFATKGGVVPEVERLPGETDTPAFAPFPLAHVGKREIN